VFWIADFLHAHAPLQLNGLTPSLQTLNKFRQDILKQLDERFASKVEELYQQVSMWMVRFESDMALPKNASINALLNTRAKLMLNGILLATQIRNLVTVTTFLHLELEKPFLKANVRSVAICIELLKAIEGTYHRRTKMIAENISHMLSQSMYVVKSIFHPIKLKLESPNSSNKFDATKQDVLAAVNLALMNLSGVPTESRRIVADFALTVAQLKDMIKVYTYNMPRRFSTIFIISFLLLIFFLFVFPFFPLFSPKTRKRLDTSCGRSMYCPNGKM